MWTGVKGDYNLVATNLDRPLALLTISKVGHKELSLVGVIDLPLSDPDNQLTDALPWIVGLFGQAGPMNLRDTNRNLTQAEISAMTLAHLELADKTGWSDSKTIVESTVRKWKFVTQMGSSKPAEVIGKHEGRVPRTINGRLNIARNTGLIPWKDQEILF